MRRLTLLLCGLALSSPAAAPAQQGVANENPDHLVVNAIHAAGGNVDFDNRAPDRPVKHVDFREPILDRDCELLRVLGRLQTLTIAKGKITDEGLKHLSGLATLKELSIYESQITDDGLVHLKGLQRLESLSINGQITGAGLIHLGGLPRLKTLEVSGARFTGVGLAALPHLKRLTIGRAALTRAGLAELGGLTELESLDLGSMTLTDGDLVHLRTLESLDRLTLSNVPITAEGLSRLAGMRRLHWIWLSNTRITPSDMAKLREATPYAEFYAAFPRLPGLHRDNSETPRWARALTGLGVLLVAFLCWQRMRYATPAGRLRLLKAAVVLGLILAIAVGLAVFAPDMAPVRDGDSATFWHCACGIDISVNQTWGSGTYLPRGDWFIYYRQGFHGQSIYRVKASEALMDFPRILRIIDAAPPGALLPDVSEGYRVWLRANPDRSDAAGLLAKIHEARLNRVHKQDIGLFQFHSERESAFDERWQRIERYHLNILFEFLYLSSLAMFLAWPWLRGAGPKRWALHFALAPALFFLPWWLGYAPLTFTSAGPEGGVLYPQLLLEFRKTGGTSSLDVTIVRLLPRLLEPLSQSPGPMMSLSGGGGVGPTAALVIGGGLALISFAGVTAARSLRAKTSLEPR